MLNQLYVLPDRVKLYVKPNVFVPQADVRFIQSQIKEVFDKNGKVSPTGVSFKLCGDQFYYQTANNFLFRTWNPMKDVSLLLVQENRYCQKRGYGEKSNFLNPAQLRGITIPHVCSLVYQNIADSVYELKELYELFITRSLGVRISHKTIQCRLFEIEITLDSQSSSAPNEILPLHYGFKCNHYVCSPFPDQQLRGIYAQILKRDKTYGSKTARMYLKTNDIIRYEHIFTRKMHKDFLPKKDLSELSALEIESLLEPLRMRVSESWEKVVQDSSFEKNENPETFKIDVLKKIMIILERKLNSTQLMHLENLIENGYLTRAVVQDDRFWKRLRETGCIIPGEQETGKKVPKLYKLNWNRFGLEVGA